MRVAGHPYGLHFNATMISYSPGSLVPIKSIKSLVICRQFYRAFSVTRTLKPLLRSLQYLENLVYEPWRGLYRDQLGRGRRSPPYRFDYLGLTGPYWGQCIRDLEHESLTYEIPRQLKRFSMFEDSCSTMHRERRANLYTNNPSGSSCFIKIGKGLASFSRNLEELYAAHNVDAKDFFRDFYYNGKSTGLVPYPPTRSHSVPPPGEF